MIGAATTLGLARKGLHVLCVDRLPAAGYGSTSSSSAIIRPYGSTVDGCALGWESPLYGNHRSSTPVPDPAPVADSLSRSHTLPALPCGRAPWGGRADFQRLHIPLAIALTLTGG